MTRKFRYINIGFFLFVTLLGSCNTRRVANVPFSQNTKSIYQTMDKVARWQVENIKDNGWRHPERDWTNGALYAGLLAFADLDPEDETYYNFLKDSVGEKFDWQLYHTANRYHADFYCVGQMFSQMYKRYNDARMITDLKLLADTLIARPHTESLEFKGSIKQREWAWCDALFMAPPALTMLAEVTGNHEYMNLVNKLWWKTTDYLYDSKEKLYFRDSRYFPNREKNGEKVFWSRGNGWVMGGLVRVLETMPETYPDRNRWIELYKEMSERVASLQQDDGTWHASLLDPASYPVKETSGTGFFCYALAWGINHDILDKKTYLPVVLDAWEALVNCVHPDGKLGFVQPIAATPDSVDEHDTEVYGVGAFLLAGSEMYKLTPTANEM